VQYAFLVYLDDDAYAATTPAEVAASMDSHAPYIEKGPEAGLEALHALRLKLVDNHLYHAARADLLGRLGRRAEAARAYRTALRHVASPAEKRFLERRLTRLR
jgi:RNA polymerase sigma-70 factor, ECF subfamily